MIESTVIRMSAQKMLTVLLMLYGTFWISIALAGILVLSIMGALWDFRFLILALIWLFLILPMLVAFLYFFYGLRPLTSFNTISHKLILNNQELTIQFIDEGSQDKKNEDEYPQNITREYNVDLNLFKEIKTGADYILLMFRDKGWLWLPVDGFKSVNELRLLQDSIMKMKYER